MAESLSRQAGTLTLIALVVSVGETTSLPTLHMKPIFTLTLLCALLAGCCTSKPRQPQTPKTTFSSFDQPVRGVVEQRYGKDEINFKGLQLREFLAIYESTSGRTLIQAVTLPAASITLRNQTPVTRVETLQLFDTALAQNGIAMIFSGEKVVKAVPIAAAGQEAAPVIDLPADQLPDSGSFMVRIVHLKKTKPSEMVPVVQPFSKVPNAIIAMDREKVIVLRDFSSNIRQMLRLIDIAEGGGGH